MTRNLHDIIKQNPNVDEDIIRKAQNERDALLGDKPSMLVFGLALPYSTERSVLLQSERNRKSRY